MFLQQSKILTEPELKKLKEHKYSSKCISILDPAMQKYWNWLVTLVPLWVAPNLITIVGLVINVVTSVILIYYCPTAKEQPPWWTTFNCGIGLFVYQSLDAIDGKQARRTGTSSPLGELFDHGCDCISTVFVSVASACATQLGDYPAWLLFQCLCASTLFYCAHWQTYVSGTLSFGKIDVTEGQFVVVIVMLLSSAASFFNVNFWGSSIPILNTPPVFLYILAGMVMAIFNVCKTIPACISPGAGKNGSTIAGTSVLSPAPPLLLLVIPAAVIAFKSDQGVFHNHPILYVITFGLIAAKLTSRLVVAHMCKSEIHHRDPALLAPLVLFLNQYFNSFLNEYWLLLLGFAWVLCDLMWYCCKVCIEICDSLNVYLFKIPAPSTTDAAPARPQNGSSHQQTTGVRKDRFSSWTQQGVPGYLPGKFN